MIVRNAEPFDKDIVLSLLDEFRADCMEQLSRKPGESTSARTGGSKIYERLLERSDYGIFLLVDPSTEVVGIITGYLCPMLRNGEVRAEVEEFFIKKKNRGNGNATLLMDTFFDWCRSHHAQKVNLESDNALLRAHSFYKKYGFESTAQRFLKKLNV